MANVEPLPQSDTEPSPGEVFGWIGGLIGSVMGGIGQITAAQQEQDGSTSFTTSDGAGYVATPAPNNTVTIVPMGAQSAVSPGLLAAGGVLVLAVVLLVKR